MKKRLISLLVALCMAVTLLPVSAITAWAEGGGQLKIVKGGYPEGSNSGSQSCSGTDWSYDKDTRTLTLSPSTPTNYDFSNNGIHTGPGNNTDCNLIIGQHATVTDGFFFGVLLQIMVLLPAAFFLLPFPMNLTARLKMVSLVIGLLRAPLQTMAARSTAAPSKMS